MTRHQKVSKRCLEIQLTQGIDPFTKVSIENQLLRHKVKNLETHVFTLEEKIKECEEKLQINKDEEELMQTEPEYKEETEKNEEQLDKFVRLAEIHYLMTEMLDKFLTHNAKAMKELQKTEDVDMIIEYLQLHKERLSME